MKKHFLGSADLQLSNSAFRSQLDYLPHDKQSPSAAHERQPALDLRPIGHALPPSMQPPMGAQYPSQPLRTSRTQYPNVMYQMQQPGYHPFATGPGYPTAQSSQGHFAYSQNAIPQFHGQFSVPQLQTQGPNNMTSSYPFAYSPHSPHNVDSRFAVSPMQGDFPPYLKRGQEPAPVPSLPRGPPRKPKQSGHALWVGNLPPGATVGELKDHFSRDATKDIESLFLISKSNCAFVNYRTEAACAAAMTRFHESRFHGVRLVCRLRRGSVANSSARLATAEEDETTEATSSSGAGSAATVDNVQESDMPVIVGRRKSSGSTSSAQNAAPPGVADAGTGSNQDLTASTGKGSVTERVPEKYFIIKSLTVQDLEASVRNGIWATQNHNEDTLNRAFTEADHVYLIFSANKSGEYFGYARMASPIAGQPVSLKQNRETTSPNSGNVPFAVFTPASSTAPNGWIIDDSARGTIFWEADNLSGQSGASGDGKQIDGEDSTSEAAMGRQFSIEWVSTARLPFYRTRGLRNPWNSNREIKIARDGTEIEPTIGRRLVQMFHRPPPMGHGQHLSLFQQYR